MDFPAVEQRLVVATQPRLSGRRNCIEKVSIALTADDDAAVTVACGQHAEPPCFEVEGIKSVDTCEPTGVGSADGLDGWLRSSRSATVPAEPAGAHMTADFQHGRERNVDATTPVEVIV